MNPSITAAAPCELPRSHADRPGHPPQAKVALTLAERRQAAAQTFESMPSASGIAPEDLAWLRRTVHMFPELGFQESLTQELILEELAALGLAGERLAGTGVMAELRAPQPGKTLMLRSDIDALPIQEENAHGFESRHACVMHACGHDAHIAILLGAARQLHAAGPVQGVIRYNFQPAEEGLNGAGAMIEAGILRGVDATLGYHIWQHLPVGKIGIVTGPAMAAVDRFEIVIEGTGGHAAMPQRAIDPIVIAAQLVTAFQTIVARNVNPFDTAVVTVGQIHAGNAFNVIPPRVTMEGTVRTFNPAVQDRIQERMTALVQELPKGFGASGSLQYHRENPALVNDAAMAEFCREMAADIVGKDNVIACEPSMGGEDHAFYQQLVPGCYAFIGSAYRERETYYHHHPKFDFDEAVLPIGADYMAHAAREWLART